MATAENRTLAITAKLNDQMTRPLSSIERAVAGFAKGSASALKSAASSFFDLKNVIVGVAGAYLGLQGLGKIKSIAEDAQSMQVLARATGDTTGNLSRLRAAF
jgi:hypothetical protein